MLLIYFAVGGDSFQSISAFPILCPSVHPPSQPSPLFLCLISRLPPAFTFPHSSQHLRLIDTIRVMSLFNWFVLCLICLFMLHLIFVFSSPLFLFRAHSSFTLPRYFCVYPSITQSHPHTGCELLINREDVFTCGDEHMARY